MKQIWLVVLAATAFLISGCGGESGVGGDGNSGASGVGFKVHKPMPSNVKSSSTSAAQVSADVCSVVGLYVGNYVSNDRHNGDSGKTLAMILPNGKAAFISYSIWDEVAYYGVGTHDGTNAGGDYYDMSNTPQGEVKGTIANHGISGTWENKVFHDNGTFNSVKIFQHKKGHTVYEHVGFLLYDDGTLAAIYDAVILDDNRMVAIVETPDLQYAIVEGHYNEGTDGFEVSGSFKDGTKVTLSGSMGSTSGSIGTWSSNGGLSGTIVGSGCYLLR